MQAAQVQYRPQVTPTSIKQPRFETGLSTFLSSAWGGRFAVTEDMETHNLHAGV
jgi:hypothetical protein